MRIATTSSTFLLVFALVQGSFAADITMPAPLPGPYQQSSYQTQVVAPAPIAPVQAQPTAQPMPYWMQAPRQQLPYWMQVDPSAGPTPINPNNFANSQNRMQAQNRFGFTAQAQAGNQGYGTSTVPGYFPGYVANQQSTPFNPNIAPAQNYPMPQQVMPNNAYPSTPYPNQPIWNGPNNGQWGQPFPNWGGMPFWWQP